MVTRKLSHDEFHLTHILDECAGTHTGVTFYRGLNTSPEYLSYHSLRNIALAKADYLRRDHGALPDQIILTHFHAHYENIVWFWASMLAGCVPAMSTPLVKNLEGRALHLAHLHQLLLDPLVITSEELKNTDFANNELLRIAVVGRTLELDPKPHITDDHNGNRERLSNGTLRGATKTTCNINGDHANESFTSLHGVAVLMLTSGSTGNAKAVCLTHRQILAACRGKLSHMPLQQDDTVLNWIGLDHVGSLTELHLTGMIAGCNQVYVSATELITTPLVFLRLLSAHRIVRSFAPNFFLQKLQQELDAASPLDTQGINLQHLLHLISGGEPNSVNTCVQISEHLQKTRCT
jgi:acyl-CoA synthetase (AMP-forming)/AMP-acid ligase II